MTFRGLTRADNLLGLGPADLVPWEEENHLHKNPRASREGTPTAACKCVMVTWVQWPLEWEPHEAGLVCVAPGSGVE